MTKKQLKEERFYFGLPFQGKIVHNGVADNVIARNKTLVDHIFIHTQEAERENRE